MTRHGLPAAKTPSGTSRVTTLPAPMTGAGADADAGADDGAAADPGVVADGDRLAGLQRAALRVIEGMQRRVDLHRRAEETEVADLHGADVEDHAVEVEVDAAAERDVGTEVAEERRLDVDLVTAGGEELLQDRTARRIVRVADRVQRVTEIVRARARRDELRIEGVIELAGEHLLALGALRHASSMALLRPREVERRDTRQTTSLKSRESVLRKCSSLRLQIHPIGSGQSAVVAIRTVPTGTLPRPLLLSLLRPKCIVPRHCDAVHGR